MLSNFEPLKTKRTEIEKVLGKPDKFFPSYGTYENETGKFSVWYSIGKCQSGVVSLQWNIPRGKMTRLLVYVNKSAPVESYVADKSLYKRVNFPEGSNRFLYTSPDEGIVYETIAEPTGEEFVYTIELQPRTDQQKFLCATKEK
jgi:hypothetical protein